MYEEFYGFRDNPFRLTPDPDYLFLSANHQEALGHLLFGINEGSGVVVITGEIGTGKTTLLRTLVRNLDPQTTVAYIFNPALSAVELLQTINADLGLPATSASKKELIDELNRFLLAQLAAGRRVVAIVDEAQDLEPGVLEQLRLLSNLETERKKLLHIILVGQPDLRDMLARPELAQLDQRVTLRWHFGALIADETAAYVRHRLRVAADGREPVQFTSGALREVYRFSQGVPRVINVLCHRTLLVSYTREERQINRSLVRQAIEELRSHEQKSWRGFAWRTAAISTLAATILLLLLGGLSRFPLVRDWLPRPILSPSEEATAQAPTIPLAESADSSPPRPTAVPIPPLDSPSATGTPPPQTLQRSLPPPPFSPQVDGPAVSAPVLTSEKAETRDAATFLQDLQRTELVDSAVRATDGLLRAWGANGLQANEWRAGTLDLTTIAQARRLEYLPVNGSLNLLLLLDLPVVMELIVPPRQEVRFVLLLGITGEHGRVFLDQEREIPMSVLSEHWFGKAHLFWKDFDAVGLMLTVGSVGQNVKRFHTLLAKANGTDPTFTRKQASGQLPALEAFSRKTEEAVAHFQKAKRLTPDGVAGPLTMILLYNSAAGYSHPMLHSPKARVAVIEGTSTDRESSEDTNGRKFTPGKEGT
jgi:general secretion pathway protein A